MRQKRGQETNSDFGNASITLRIGGKKYRSPLSGGTGEMTALYRAGTETLVCANEMFCGHFSLNKNEAFGKALPPSFQELAREKFSDFSLDRPTARTVQSHGPSEDETRWYEWIGRGFFDADGAIEAVMVSGRDITNFGATPERVGEFDAYYQHFIECITDVVYFTDKNGIIRYISGVVEQVSQWKAAEVTGIHYMTFIHPDDVMSHIEYMKAVLSGESQRPFISRIRRKDGAYQYASMVSRRVVMNGDVEGVVGIISHAETPISNEYRVLKMLLYLLSDNERTVLMHLADNAPRRNIARIMNTVPEAVDTYIRRIKKKLKTDSVDPIVEMIRMFPREYFLSE